MKATLTHALVRPPGESFVRAISSRNIPIDSARARAQHAEYCQALQAAGLTVETLPPDERFPDSCFMQDPALVIRGQAVIGRLAAATRSGEEAATAQALARYFPIAFTKSPATLEGGDVMVLPDRVLVGLSARTNAAGVTQLADLLSSQGLPVTGVPVHAYLHLLSAAMYVGQNTMLAVRDFAEHPAFHGLDVVVVPPEEAYAVNVLASGTSAGIPAGYPRVAEMLRARGFQVLPVPTSEFAAADGGVTCLALAW